MNTFTARFLLLLPFLIGIHIFSQAQTTVNFDEITGSTGNSLNGTNTYDNSGVRFQIFSGSNNDANVSSFDQGFNDTRALDDTNLSSGGVTGWKISKVDGSAFQLISIWLQEGCGCSSSSGTVKAFKSGSQVGSTVNLDFDSRANGAKNFVANPDFYDVDEIRIEGVDLYVLIDNFTYGSPYTPVDGNPPVVSSIALVGTPVTTATTVDYTVTFSKNAKNVTSDDFELTTVGTTGTVGAVSGSGTTYTVTVNGIDGEGTIRLDLKAGTDIANDDDVTGTPAFTLGQIHNVGECFVETFETETDESTTFSGNGLTFTLGAGLKIEKRLGFGAGPSSGYIANNFTAGTFSVSSGTEFTMKTIDLFLSDMTNGNNPTGTGTLVITGKKGGIDQFTITKTTGFPTNTAINNGFFTLDFATEGPANYRDTNVDELVFTISGGFIELAIDNMNFCEAAPDVDSDAPAVNSILKVGNPISTASTVDFQVTFDENANNVTTDDFELIRTGTATGAITGISGSGSIYTLNVTGISGEGSIQVKLLAGTDIADDLNNTPPFEYVNGEIHLVGACYIENFETFLDGITSFTSNGVDFTLGGNWAVNVRNGFGINSSDTYIENTGVGTYTLSNNIPVTFSQIAFFLSSEAGSSPNPTDDGTLTIRGIKDGGTVYTITKSTGFPTDFSSNNGFFYVDFSSEGGSDNSGTFVDGLEIEIGGSFSYMAVDNLQFCKDFDAPTGYTVTIDQDPITAANAGNVSFTFGGGEIGATYDYEFTSDGGGTPVVGSGTLVTAIDQITGIDLSGLGAGTVTLTATLTDPSGNEGAEVTDTSTKLINNAPTATTPTAPTVSEDVTVSLADDIQVADVDGDDQTVSFNITGGTVTIGTTGITFGGSGNGSANFTASGTLAAINSALDAATFTPTPNLFGTNAGTIAFISNDGSVDSNVASVTFDIQAVNDDPTFSGLPASITVLEDASGSSLIGALSNGTFSDIDAGSSEVVLFVTTSSGTFSLAAPGGIPVTLAGNAFPTISITGSQAAIEAYISINSNIVYNPASNVAGVNAALVTLEANDNGNTGTGGGTRVEIGSFNINITPVNDDPTFVGLPTDISVQNGVASNLDLSSATFGDVDSGSGNVTLSFLVSGGTLSATSTADVAVSFPIPGAMNLVGTAAAIENFLNSASSIQYTNAPGSTGDNAATLSISANDNGNTGTGGGVPVNFGTINIDVVTPIPSVTLSSVTIAQAESVADPVVITATLSNSFGSDVTVNLGFSGTATGGGVDYASTGTSITITPGNTTGSISLTNVPDALYEGNETVIIDITSVTNGNEDGVQQLTYTIVDDDPLPTATLEVLNIYNPIIDESGGQAYVRAILDVVAGTTVTVPLSFSGTASGGGTDYSITGSTITISPGEIMDSIRVTSQFDGIEENSETIIIDMETPTNAIEGTPNQVTITIIDEDASPPAGYSVAIDQSAINNSNQTAASFTFASAELGAIYNYQFNSSGGGGTVSGSGTIATASDQITGIDLSGLGDGIITLSATLEDAFGNVGSPATDTKNKDTVDPSGYAVSIDLLGETQINSINQTIIEFTGTGLETGATLSYSFTSDGGGTPVSGSELVTSANQTFSNGGAGYDLSGLSDGLVTLTVYLTDPAGNQGGNASNTANKDVGAPTGYSVAWDDALINASEASNTSFTLSNGEIGATAFYSISSSGDGNTATVSGTTLVTNNSQAISVNVSSLVDGTLTVSVYLKDGSGNNGATVSDNSALLDQTPPAAPSVPDLSAASDSGISDSDDITNDVTPTFEGTAIPNSTVTLTSNIDGNVGSTTANGSGDWSITSSTLSSGIHSISATATDLAGNTSAASAGIQVTIDILAPTPILINGLALQLDVNGNAPTITAADLLATPVTDDYSSSGNIQLALDKTDFNCSDVGINNVTVTATDQAGNSDFAVTNVLVQDLIGPTILAKAAITLNVDAFGTVNLTPAMIDEGSTDACGIQSQVLSQTIFDRNDEGINTITYTVTDVNGNPSQVNVEVTIVVVPKVLSITADPGQSKVYGDADPVYTFTATGFEGGDDETILTGALTRLAGENVGTYAIQLGTLDAGPNYSINFTPANFEITPASLDISADAGQSKVYGDADPVFTYTVNGLKNGDTEAVVTGALIRTAGEDVGNYAIQPGTIDAGSNYTVNFNSSDFEITTATLDITADAGQTKVYGAADPVFTYSVGGLKNGDTESVISGSLIRIAGEDVGMYAIQPGTIDAGSNYTINFNSADFEITPATLGITADAGQTKVYGNADPIFTYQVSGLQNGDTEAVLSGVLARAVGENVGAYAINLGTLDAGSNYTINFTGADFTITPRTLSIVANPNQAKVYGSPDPVLGYTASNFGNGDNTSVLTGALSRVAGEDVGLYAITLGSLDAGSNYIIDFTSADFEIAEKVLDVVADAGQGKVFGTADPVLTYQVSGFENGDDTSILTGALVRASGENVGSYAISLGTLDAGSNYAINFTGADFTISKAMIVGVTFDDGSFVYDGTSKSLSISGALPTGTNVTYTNNSRTDVGSQEVTATISGSNYNSLVLTADLTITPATITGITFNDGSFVYDGTSKSLAISGELPAGSDVTYTNNSRTEVGSQEVTATIIGSNFTSFNLTAELSITPATLEIVADSGQSKLYGESDPELTYSATGFGEGDDESILTGTLERTAGESVGMYDILLGSLNAGTNYLIDFTGAEFEIISGDTDGDGVPDEVEEEQGTDPEDPMDYQDLDGDGVPDFVEDEQGTDPSNSGDYLDTDGDKVPDYIEEQQGTDPDDAEDFPDEDGNGIPDYVDDKAVVEFVDQTLEALWGTEVGDLKVPTEVVGITSEGMVVNFPVIWDLNGYDPLVSGTVNYLGTVELPDGVFNPQGLQPVLELTVLAKPAPTDVTLSENTFIGLPAVFFQEIGVFTVIDPTDDVHTLSLPEGVQDNDYFEVIDGILFWSSAGRAQGKTQFTITLQVIDRGGNVFEKSFQITRQRTPLGQLDVPNTFTPNNDGVNDTWGVPALRYYQGVRISIMEVGGNRVFYTENPDIRWDGTFDGKSLPVGAYFWIIEVAETGEVRRGVLNLLKQ